MKKCLILLCFILCANAEVIKAADNNDRFAEMNAVVSNEDMELVQSTTAYFFNEFSWFNRDASVWRNKRDGSYWIKIDIFASPGYVKCRVQRNPDYTSNTNIRGLHRTNKKYMAVGNGITYYFNCDI